MDIEKSKNINGVYNNSSCSKFYIVIYILMYLLLVCLNFIVSILLFDFLIKVFIDFNNMIFNNFNHIIFDNFNHMIAKVIPLIYSSIFYIVILMVGMLCLQCLVDLFVGMVKECYGNIKKLIKL